MGGAEGGAFEMGLGTDTGDGFACLQTRGCYSVQCATRLAWLDERGEERGEEEGEGGAGGNQAAR
jgi:hypothetical protein